MFSRRLAAGSLRCSLASLASLFAAQAPAHADGLVGCWGSNISGQCAVPASLGIATQISAGVEHTVAINTASQVLCWGSNADNQCLIPGNLGTVTAVAAGYYHNVALKTTGTVMCWGLNDFFQCNVPANLGTCIAVGAGYDHSIAIKTGGTVACWGDNSAFQCAVPTNLGTCTKVAGGAYHTIALRTAGTVICWGLNNFGQSVVPPTLGSCTAIAGGWYHTVALKSNGTVACWGDNGFGQCNVPANLGTVTAIASGYDHTLALRTNGTVAAWGRNDWGQASVPATLPACNRIAAGNDSSVVVSSGPVIQFVSMTPTTCGIANGAVDLTITNAVSVAWTGPNNFTATTVDLANVAAGTYIVTATGAAFTSPAQAQVIVTATADTTPPAVTSYTNALSAAANPSCQAAVANFAATVVATDNCSVTAITQVPAAGTMVGLGNTAVVITIRDAANNSVTRNATFTVTGTNATWFRDADGDTFGNASVTATGCAAPTGYVANNTDCNDNNAAINPNTVWYRDLDGDGAGNAADGTLTQCATPAGYALTNNDGCPTDPAKTAAGACGCGVADTDSDGDGVPNCHDNCINIANADQRDCDNNGVGDVCQIAAGTPPDCNHNGAYDVPGEYATIQAAIDAVGPGTPRVVLVATGTFPGPINLRGKDVVVRGLSQVATIVQGTAGAALSVATFNGGEPATAAIENLTIRSGTVGTPLLLNGAATRFYGGGVLVRGASGALRSVIVENCGAEFGGGVAVVGGSFLLDSCIVRSSTATTDGGGIYISTGMVQLNATTVTANHAPYGGGIAKPSVDASTSLTLNGSDVCGNTVWNINGSFTQGAAASHVCDCPGDVDGNGVINALDIAALLTVWNTDGGAYPRADGNHDGAVNALDVALLLSGWGACAP